MDIYLKVVLTVIAIALSAIALSTIPNAQAMDFGRLECKGEIIDPCWNGKGPITEDLCKKLRERIEMTCHPK